jgi:TonB family protein
MPDDNNLIPQNEMPASTTDEVLRLLSEQSAQSNGDDLLENPELERLFGSLSEGLDEGLQESAQTTGLLTLEELVLGAPAVPDARESVVCSDCGSRNPAATRFCGMCGHELGKSKAEGNGNGHTVALAVAEPAPQPEVAVSTSAGKGWKIAFLVLLCLVLGLVVYQQKLWRLPLWSNLHSLAAPPAPALPKAPTAPASLVTQPGAASSEASSANVRPSAGTKPSPSKPTFTGSEPPVAEPPAKSAPVAASSAAPSPSMAKQEPQERAPAISMPAVPIELPTIVSPPNSSPVLQGSRTAPAAHEPSAPKISAGVVPGAVIFKVNPQYPVGARSARAQGAVVMQAVIGTDGTVQQLRAISGHPLLVSAAMEAVKKWRYSPFLLDGKPVEGETNITINFKGE